MINTSFLTQKNQSIDFIQQVWSQIPWSRHAPSDRVDLCLLFAGLKPSVRLSIGETPYRTNFLNTMKVAGFDTAFDGDGYSVISPHKGFAEFILAIDQRNIPHAFEFGQFLGYPDCCARFIDHQGEHRIDELALAFVKENLKDPYRFIDISAYDKGIGLISHVPCAYDCKASLEIALGLKRFIESQECSGDFSLWKREVRSYFNF